MSLLITDQDTNKVYFSEYIKSRYKYWKNIEAALIEAKVDYEFLPYTNDIWARDFMPLQLTTDRMLGYTYNPDYLHGNKYITDYNKVMPFVPLHLTLHTDLVLDGGNMVKCGNCVIMTDKIYKENKDLTHTQVRDKLTETMQCKVVVVPHDPDEIIPAKNGFPDTYYGHTDSLVRWLKNDQVLINHINSSKQNLFYKQELKRSLEKQGLKVSELDYSKDGEYVSVNSWCYLNFLRVGNKIFVPCYGGKEQEYALQKLGEFFSECRIFPIMVSTILRDGGGMNCVTWNVKI